MQVTNPQEIILRFSTFGDPKTMQGEEKEITL